MVRKFLKCILKIIIFIFVYLLQIYVVNNTTFFGVTGDLCLMAVVLTTLMESNTTSYITAAICGIASDLLFSPIIFKYTVIYIIITAVLIGFKKMYKQDSKMAVIIFSVSATAISEIMMIIFSIVLNWEFVNVFAYIFNVLKVSIINICLAYVEYLVFKPFIKEG